jgi:hypothetical protein
MQNLVNNKWTLVGEGQEAEVFKGRIKVIEGLDSFLSVTHTPVIAKRVNWNKKDKQLGHRLFCKHLSAYILDSLFLNQQRYSNSHIPLPMGSFETGYYYQFSEGVDGFPLEIMNENYSYFPVQIKDWNPFVELFNLFGFEVHTDTADVSDGRNGKNVVFEKWDINEVYDTGCLHNRWKRIDFGSISMPFHPEIFQKRMSEKQREITGCIGNENYHLASLSIDYFLNNNLKKDDLNKFLHLVNKFRKKTLSNKSY